MKKKLTISDSIYFGHQDGYCPECKRVASLGEINVDLTINLAPDASERNVVIQPTRLLHLDNSIFSNSFIRYICPYCGHTDMIIVDNRISNLIEKFNQMGFTTVASCDGSGDSYSLAYIQFEKTAYEKLKKYSIDIMNDKSITKADEEAVFGSKHLASVIAYDKMWDDDLYGFYAISNRPFDFIPDMTALANYLWTIYIKKGKV